MAIVDLHVHTTVSDGTASPEQAVEAALAAGLSALAITDHDSASGCAPGALAGAKAGIEVVPGIEISTRFDRAVHILGYYIDPRSPELSEALNWITEDRDARNRHMAEVIASDGYPVDYDEMKSRFGEIIGRPHFAQIFVELGLASSIDDAFDKYVEKGRKYYVGRNFLSLERSIKVITASGGVAVLAHPFQYKMSDGELRGLLRFCMEQGLSGIECRYSGYTPEQSAYLECLAEEYSMLKTGGSDFHGSRKPHIHIGSGTGGLCVPYEFLARLKENAPNATR